MCSWSALQPRGFGHSGLQRKIPNPNHFRQMARPCSSLDKTAEVVGLCETLGVAVPTIQIDGGINAQTIVPCVAAGARCFVAGNAVFGAPDPIAAIAEIRAAGESVLS